MKYLKFTYVDSATGIPVTNGPAANGPAFPAVDGLVFEWARESRYPTDVPEFFGTCPEDSDIAVPGVLGEYIEADWLTMRDDEMRARSKVPQAVTMRQARLALHRAGLLSTVDAAIAGLPEPGRTEAQIEWEYAQEVRRDSPLVSVLGAALELDDAKLDALFVDAVGL